MVTIAWTIFRTRAVLLKHFKYSIERRPQAFLKDNSKDAFVVSTKFSKLGYAMGAFLIFLFVSGFGSLSVSHYQLQLLGIATKNTTVSGEFRLITTGAWPAIYYSWTVSEACALSFFIISWLPPRAGTPPVTQTDLWFLKKDHNMGKSYLILFVLVAAYSCAAAAGMEVALCCLVHAAFLGFLSWHVCVAICKDTILHVRAAEDDLAVAAFE